ncbi:MAG: pilus assembly protein [Clostridiaceae bacterium]|nr:pilus assembly protein [Clostridiaceae bacterium]
MSGVRAIRKKSNRKDIIRVVVKERIGSVTAETAITLTVFLLVIFSFAYILKIFFVYNTVQASLSDVSRNLANLSYFYHISGAKEFDDQIKELADEAGLEMDEQKNTIVEAFNSFNNLFDFSESSVPISLQQTNMDELINAVKNGEDLANLFHNILTDPKEELKLFMRIFAGNLNYEITNKLVCFVAKNSLKSELSQRLNKTYNDPALALRISEGIKGIDLNQSSIFGDSETIELVAKYKVEPFFFMPGLNLINRVKIVAWTGGRGASAKKHDNTADAYKTSEDSTWEEYDNKKLYFERGIFIEEEYLKKIKPESRELDQGMLFSTNTGVAAIDAYKCRDSGKNSYTVELYDVFSLNPFLKTYSTRPSSIESQIKKHGKQLYEATLPKGLQEMKISEIKRIVILVVPENSEAIVDEAVNNAKKSLEKYGIEIILYRGFGNYVSDDESQAA